jgi:spermidine/putrescine transport system substrate-binding protein
MAYHPRERGRGGEFDRRTFLLRSAAVAAFAAGGGSALLAACGGDDDGGASGSGSSADAGPVKLSRPDDPATLPLFDDIPPIDDGLDPESGTLKLFNYAEYINPDTVAAFEDEYGVKVEITTFTTMDEAVEKLRTGGTKFDVFFPTPDVIGKVVAGKLLQPINKAYITNFANVWPALQDPFYDKGSQYSVPYTLYTTGVAFRRDRVTTEPAALASGYDILWDPEYKGRTYILNDDREALGMALIRAGVTDVNTEDQALIQQALADLNELASAVDVKTGIEAYQRIPDGTATVHQAWSGDAVNAQYYLPDGGDVATIGYWYPHDQGGVIGSDTLAIPANAEKPVLAHLFLNYMLSEEGALDNYSWLGYQPPQNALDPETVVADGYVPEHLADAIVREEDFVKGVQLLQLSREGEATWDNAWSEFTTGA